MGSTGTITKMKSSAPKSVAMQAAAATAAKQAKLHNVGGSQFTAAAFNASLISSSSTSAAVTKIPPREKEETVSVLAKRREAISNKLAALEKRAWLSKTAPPPFVPRLKSHMDFLLEEIQWMAVDFRQERRWKFSVAKSVATQCAEKVNCNYNSKTRTVVDGTVFDYEDNKEIVSEAGEVAKRLSRIVSEWWDNEIRLYSLSRNRRQSETRAATNPEARCL